MTNTSHPYGPHTTGARAPHGEGRVRAVVVDGPGQHRIVRGPPPAPGAGEVRIAVQAAGMCACDRDVYEGTRPHGYVRYPVTPGHEWSGTVDAVGEDVDPALTGRKTVGEGFRSCLRCARCREGAARLCLGGYDETGFTRPGAFADSLMLPARLLHPLPDGADLRAAALLEPASVAAAAVLAGGVRPGDRVAVVGADTLGLLAVQLLAASTPGALLAVDPHPHRTAQALGMGASAVCAPQEAGGEQGGYDVVLETAGAAGTAIAACSLARRGGRVVLAGVFEPGAHGVDPAHLVFAQLTVQAVFGAPSAAWSYAVRAFTAGLLDPGALITHEFSLDRFDEALAALRDQQGMGKVLVRP